MTPEREEEVRKLVARIESERGITWGISPLGTWTTNATPGGPACEALFPLLAALDEARRERDEMKRVLEVIAERIGVTTIGGVLVEIARLAGVADKHDVLRAALAEACDGWEDGCSYKLDYLVEKHGDREEIARLRALLEPST